MCTFGRAAGRTTTADYTRHLENKVAELQAILQQRYEAAEQLQQHGSLEEGGESTRNSLIDTVIRPEDDYIFVPSQRHTIAYHGRYGGLSTLRVVRNLCDTVTGPALAPVDVGGSEMAEAFDTSLLDLPFSNDIAAFALLPPQGNLESTITIALNVALSCKEFLDRDELWRDIHSLYERDPEDHQDEDKSFLALVYALMALGRRYEPHKGTDIEVSAPDRATLKGFVQSVVLVARLLTDSIG